VAALSEKFKFLEAADHVRVVRIYIKRAPVISDRALLVLHGDSPSCVAHTPGFQNWRASLCQPRRSTPHEETLWTNWSKWRHGTLELSDEKLNFMNILLTTKTKPTLHFLCGKMATGKSTLYNALAVEKNAVLICEDLWLSRLYPTEIASFDNYLMYSARPKDIMKPHLTDLLRQGTCVVLDFPPTCRVSASGSATFRRYPGRRVQGAATKAQS